MKRSAYDFVFIGVIMLALCINLSAQTVKKSKVYSYKVVVHSSIQRKVKGILDEIIDSSIYVFANHHRIRIPSTSIREIKIKRMGSVGKGALIGGLAGLGTGLIAGFADGDDECGGTTWCMTPMTAEEKAIIGGIAIGSIGALIGCIIGSASHVERIVINEDQNAFLSTATILKRYALSSRLPMKQTGN